LFITEAVETVNFPAQGFQAFKPGEGFRCLRGCFQAYGAFSPGGGEALPYSREISMLKEFTGEVRKSGGLPWAGCESEIANHLLQALAERNKIVP